MQILLRLVQCLLNITRIILLPILSLVKWKKPPAIPSTTDPFLTLSAATIAKKIRLGEITSYEVVNAYVERIKEVNPFINAVVDKRFEDAIIQAKVYDERLKSRKVDPETLEKESPLYGVPFTVKESCGVKGLSQTGCTLSRKDAKATEDGVVVKALRNAGAIPLCVTNTPEMCCSFETANYVYGRTGNPYDSRCTAGGSSGGEAALIGAGASVLGIGSDIAGSLRIPALFNGIFGYKPSPGIFPNEGHIPMSADEKFNKLLTLGPLTRYAEDLMLVTKVVAPGCDLDLRLDTPVDLKLLKVYYQQSLGKTFGMRSATSDMQRCVLQAAGHFKQCNIQTEKLPIEFPTDIVEMAIATYMNIEKFPQILIDADNPKIHKNPWIEMGKALLGRSQHTKFTILFMILVETHLFFTKADLPLYIEAARTTRQRFIDLLGDDGIFIFPTFRTPTYFSEYSLFELMNLEYCAIFNNFGFPAVHVPMGLNRSGLPIGVQVIAAPQQDRLCLAVAKELETAFGGWVSPTRTLKLMDY